MNDRQRDQLNSFFVNAFNNIMLWEERALLNSGITNLSIKEIHVISAVVKLQAENNNTMSQIAAALNISVGALTTSVNTLIRKGYLQRFANEKDRRKVFVSATENGMIANGKHEQFHELMLKHIGEVINEDDMEILTRSLSQLASFFELLAIRESVKMI